MMMQWQRCKVKAKDAVLLFRLGDFYEAFYEDAHILSKELELTLTKRQGVPMSGIPAQSVDNYIEKLISRGFLVAIADQMEDAKATKGIVKREVTRIVSPATHVESSFLKEKTNYFFASLCQVNQEIGIAFLDLSTGEFIVSEVQEVKASLDELHKRAPSELLLSQKFYKENKELLDQLKGDLSIRLTVKEDWHFDYRSTHNFLSSHFKVHSLDAFGLKGMVASINAAGVLLTHISDDLNQKIDHIDHIGKDCLSKYLLIDQTTEAHLNILGLTKGEEKSSLLALIDHTSTPMGGRCLKKWLAHPLNDPVEISSRADGVSELFSQSHRFDELLSPIKDLERLVTRVKREIATPRDLLGLASSLEAIPSLYSAIKELNSPIFSSILSTFIDFSPLAQKIESAICESPPLRLTEGGIFKRGYSKDLDEILTLKEGNEAWLSGYQSSLREEVGIKTLKVNYSRAFGYFIEVSRLQSQKMPKDFERKQTLINAERFISPVLKEYESKILSAEERLFSLEYELFLALRKELGVYADAIFALSSQIAVLDCLTSLAILAKEHNYKRPSIDASDFIEIDAGRHPIVETTVPDHSFVPNNTLLDCRENTVLLLTGPNMAGKSTYMRQVALIVILAQIGSFVPAKRAHIGVVDKLFSRIGASDNLSRGQSTFMVEMTETANILHNATPKSLIILDEIGRGTSTYDGISIAFAVAKHILTQIGAKTLFATHYPELTKLAHELPNVKNFKVAVQENEDGILFLHKIIPGHADKSYGIHVAKLAGLPSSVINQASSMLKEMESSPPAPKGKKVHPKKNDQFLLFSTPDPDEEILSEIRRLDSNKLTPIEALQKIALWNTQLNS